MSTFLASQPDVHSAAAQAWAESSLGRPVMSIEHVGGGRNSRVYRVQDDHQRAYALKAYFRPELDHRDRQKVEFTALEFLSRNGVRNVPQPLAADDRGAYALYSYVEGGKISPAQVSAAEIEAAICFLDRLKDLARRQPEAALPMAAEACFSGDELLKNLHVRYERLQKALGNDVRADFREFMLGELLPACDRIMAAFQRRWPCERMLARCEQTLSPSDFGFHNALQTTTGEWFFLDFEYFGWDDPAKLIADFILHPAMELNAELKAQWVQGLLASFADDVELSERLIAFYPLYGLKWCAILLNEFLPEHLIRRQFAAEEAHDRTVAQKKQLAKARNKIQQVCREYEQFPYT